MDDPTQSLVLDDGSICSACLRYRRRALSDRETERYRPHNDRAHPPSRPATDPDTWVCDCGLEDPFARDYRERHLETGRVIRYEPHLEDHASVRETIKRAIVALEAVGHDVDRQAFAEAALVTWYDELAHRGLSERTLEALLDDAIAAAVTPRDELGAREATASA